MSHMLDCMATLTRQPLNSVMRVQPERVQVWPCPYYMPAGQRGSRTIGDFKGGPGGALVKN